MVVKELNDVSGGLRRDNGSSGCRFGENNFPFPGEGREKENKRKKEEGKKFGNFGGVLVTWHLNNIIIHLVAN